MTTQTQTRHTGAETTVISCGCCRGPAEDRCCCHMHQDIQRGLRAHKCSLHGVRPADPTLPAA